AYSVAIALSEALLARDEGVEIKIYATDLDEGALAVARRGLFPGQALREIPQEMARRYFTAEGERCRIKRVVRNWIIFCRHDLERDPQLARIDLLICRGLFSPSEPTRWGAGLARVEGALREGGYLLLGRGIQLPYLRRFAPIYLEGGLFQKGAGFPPPELSRP